MVLPGSGVRRNGRAPNRVSVTRGLPLVHSGGRLVRQGEAERIKTELLAGRALDIRSAAAYKAALCLRDPRDRDVRQWLNLGHTFAHALEAAADFDLPHGEAVALGLLAALRLSGRDTSRVVDALDPKPVRVDRERAWAARLLAMLCVRPARSDHLIPSSAAHSRARATISSSPSTTPLRTSTRPATTVVSTTAPEDVHVDHRLPARLAVRERQRHRDVPRVLRSGRHDHVRCGRDLRVRLRQARRRERSRRGR